MASGPCRALVVVDEPAPCALVGDELRQRGYDCTVGAHPEQSLGLLDGNAFDLVLAGISPPRLSGLDVLVCAKRKAPDCRAVLITAHGTRGRVAQTPFLGAFDYAKSAGRNCAKGFKPTAAAAP